MRHAVDKNQAGIVAALRAAGASVFVTSTVGGGFTDLVVGHKGVTYLFEVKNPNVPKADRQLTPEQVIFFDSWKGHAEIVMTIGDALDIVFAESI